MLDPRLGVIGHGPRSGPADHAHRPDRGPRGVACREADPDIPRTGPSRPGPDGEPVAETRAAGRPGARGSAAERAGAAS